MPDGGVALGGCWWCCLSGIVWAQSSVDRTRYHQTENGGMGVDLGGWGLINLNWVVARMYCGDFLFWKVKLKSVTQIVIRWLKFFLNCYYSLRYNYIQIRPPYHGKVLREPKKYKNPQIIWLSGFFIVQRNTAKYSDIQPKVCPLLEFFRRYRVIVSINACLWTSLA